MMRTTFRPFLAHSSYLSPWRLPLLSILVFLGMLVGQLRAHTSAEVGVDSNFVTVGDKVFFVQADRTLTVLDLRTGAVLARLLDGDYSSTLRQIDEGILAFGYSRVTLVDLDSLTLRWSVAKPLGIREITVLDRCLVTSDRKGLVECRELRSGVVQWTYNLPGAVNIVAQKDHVLIHQDYEKYPTVVVLLELSTGREVYRKEPPNNVQYLRAYFDGDQAYVALGSVRQDESGNAEALVQEMTFDRLLAWDLAGKETANFEAPANVRGKDSFGLAQEEFTIEGRRFTRSGVVCPEYGECPDVGPTMRPLSRATGRIELPDGSIRIRNFLADIDGELGTVVERVSPVGGWKGYLPYVGFNGSIVEEDVAGDCLLLGSNQGHVECVDVATGGSRWLYVFPAVSRIGSYSFPYGMPPYYADQARAFRRKNEGSRNARGLIRLSMAFREDTARWVEVVSSAENEQSTVIVDPSPQDLFEDLPYLLAEAWLGATMPILVLLLVVLVARENKKLPRWTLAGLWTAALLVGGSNLFSNGRVAFSSTVAIKLGLTVSGCFLLFHIFRLFKERHRVIATVYLGLLLVAAYLLYMPMRYA